MALMLHSLNPNQFALPGMERHAHPWARMVKQGLTLHYEHEEAANEHVLYAHDTESARAAVGHGPDFSNAAASLQWGDQHTRMNYPGEVAWVGNDTRDKRYSARGRKGVAAALFESGHHFNFGQDTVPIHSPSRTWEGEKFASSTMPHMGYSRKPPENTHPFEQADAARSVEIMKGEKARHKRNLHPRLFEGYG